MCSYLTQVHIVAAAKVQHIMKEIFEVVRLVPQEFLQRVVEEIVDTLLASRMSALGPQD